MESRAVGGLDACRFARGPGIPWSWDRSNRSDQLGLWVFTALFSFWTLVHCSYVDGAAATNAYEVPSAGSACLRRGRTRCHRLGGVRPVPVHMRGPVRVWALADGAWRVASGAAARHFSLGVEYRTACLQLSQVRQSNPPTTTQTPQRDTAKGTTDVVTICSFPMQGDKPASTEGTYRAGEQQAVGTPGQGGRHCDKKRWGGSKRAAAGGAAIGRWGTVGTVGRQGGGRRGAPRPVCGRAGGNKARGCWRNCNGAGEGGTSQEHRDRVKKRRKKERGILRPHEGENPRRRTSIFYECSCVPSRV